MSRLRAVKSAEVLSALSQAGFQRVRQRGSHLRLRHSDGRIVTVPDHGAQDLGRGLLRKILRDAELSVDEFLHLL
jgi:predicted RNA binding protein YcfA (HicA-like mRNA interferase family)